jgi:hypothetical protein
VRSVGFVNVRMFVITPHSIDDLVRLGTLTRQAAQVLEAAPVAGLNILVVGETEPGRKKAPCPTRFCLHLASAFRSHRHGGMRRFGRGANASELQTAAQSNPCEGLERQPAPLRRA